MDVIENIDTIVAFVNNGELDVRVPLMHTEREKDVGMAINFRARDIASEVICVQEVVEARSPRSWSWVPSKRARKSSR